MSIRKKTMLMLFVDYVVCLIIQFLFLLFSTWMFKADWVFKAYSLVFSLVFFGKLYSRTHKAAKRDLLHKELKPLTEGLIMAAPLAIFNLLVILFFGLVKNNILPIRDVVVQSYYTFPDNEPRMITEVFFIDYLTTIVRVWFSSLIGFCQDSTPVLLLLVSPIMTLAAGFLGYVAGSKKFYLSDLIYKTKEKVKTKFNE